MLSGIEREYQHEERLAREAQYYRELAAEEARAAERLAEDAYCERAAQSLARGESEEEFEAREMAAQAAQYRTIEFANAAILEVFRRAA